MSTYTELKNTQPELFECFFAFSNEQFAEGVKKANIEGKKIYRGCGGFYGTQEGIKKFTDFHDDIIKQISEQCTPQEVYNYEFSNHECSYVCNDSEAIGAVLLYFTRGQARKVKRRYAYSDI